MTESREFIVIRLKEQVKERQIASESGFRDSELDITVTRLYIQRWKIWGFFTFPIYRTRIQTKAFQDSSRFRLQFNDSVNRLILVFSGNQNRFSKREEVNDIKSEVIQLQVSEIVEQVRLFKV